MQRTVDNRRCYSHRIVWEWAVGLILIGIEVDFLLYLDGRTLQFIELNLLDIESDIGCLWLQDDIISGAGLGGDARTLKFVNLVALLGREVDADVLGIAPTILHGQLQTVGIIGSLHIETNQIIACGQGVSITSREDKELVPIAIWLIVHGTIDDCRSSTHCIVREGLIRHILETINRSQCLYLGIRIDVQLTVFQQFVQKLHRLLCVPSQGVAIDADACFLGVTDKILHSAEIHFAVFIHA